MEQLAERRMQREEEAQLTAAGLGHPSMHHGPQEEDDGYDDDEDDEEYDSQEEDEFEEEEMVRSSGDKDAITALTNHRRP